MPRAGLSRDAVVALALDVVDDGGPTGFADLTLAAVAARAGVAVPSLYKHVDGLPALRREVARASVEGFTAQVEAARTGTSPGRDELRATAHAIRDFARSHPGRYDAVQGSSWAQDPAASDVQAAAARSVEVAADVLLAAGADPGRVIDAVRAFRSAVHGFVRLELDGGFGMPQDVDASFDYLVDLVVGGLTR